MVEPTPPVVAPRPGATARAVMLLSRIALGVVFAYAAYTKLRHPWMLFAMSINSYQVLPEGAVTLLARTLPWLELVLGLLLLAGVALRYVAAAASALLLGFFSIMLSSYVKGLGIDCGCFGFGEKLGVRTLLRDGFLLAVSLALTVGAFWTERARGARVLATLDDPESK
jgi:uncharacterized membrane protein YphA (DoxX/SURF4 family)